MRTLINLSMSQIIIFGVMLLGVYYFTLFDKGDGLKQEIDRLQQQSTKAGADIQKQKKKLEDILLFVEQVKQREEAVQYFLKYIPEDMTTIDLFSFLNKEAKETGVNIEDKRDGEITDVDAYEGLRVDIKLSGSFIQVLLFLSNLTAQKQVIIVDKTNINLKSGNIVTADVSLMAFRYNKEKQKEKAEKDKKEG